MRDLDRVGDCFRQISKELGHVIVVESVQAALLPLEPVPGDVPESTGGVVTGGGSAVGASYTVT